MASNKFEEAFRKLLAKSHPGVREKLKALLKKWAEGDFKSDPSLMIIPGLYSALLREGTDFSGTGEHVQVGVNKFCGNVSLEFCPAYSVCMCMNYACLTL